MCSQVRERRGEADLMIFRADPVRHLLADHRDFGPAGDGVQAGGDPHRSGKGGIVGFKFDQLDDAGVGEAVSYTHLDVYKRQICICISSQ